MGGWAWGRRGGPGAGKGTQCSKIVEKFGYQHISAGDCLRAERKNPNSKNGALINQYIKEGKIVPVEITVKLLKKAMDASEKTKFLIDGFPRSLDNLQAFDDQVQGALDLQQLTEWQQRLQASSAGVAARMLHVIKQGRAGSSRLDEPE